MTDPLITATLNGLAARVDIAAGDQQQQIDALEKLVLNRASLVDIRLDGRKVDLMFTRKGGLHKLTFYADMSFDIAAARKELLDE